MKMFKCLIVLLVSVAILAQEAKAPTEEDWAWLSKNEGPILDELLPNNNTVGSYIGYRSVRDLYTNVPEYSFLIGFEADTKRGVGLNNYLTAHAREPQGISVRDQLMVLHRKEPRAQAADLKNRIKLKVLDVTEKDCPAVRIQFKKFSTLRFSAPKFSDTIIVHPMVHAFEQSSTTGGMSFAIEDDSHPLVQWALETRKKLDQCRK